MAPGHLFMLFVLWFPVSNVQKLLESQWFSMWDVESCLIYTRNDVEVCKSSGFFLLLVKHKFPLSVPIQKDKSKLSLS